MRQIFSRRGTCIALAAVALVLTTSTVFVAQPQASQAPADLRGRTILITGSTDGLGRAVALRVADLGAHVIVHGRNRDRGEALVAEITRGGRGSARFYAADFSSLDEVRQFSEAVRRDYPRIDVLVNNAGVWNRGDRQVSRDGLELHFAVNYLSHFLLTRELLPNVVAAAPSRIVNVASVAQSPIDFGDVMLERPGRAAEGYGQSKLAQILFTVDLADELRDRGVIVVALHPATLMNTTMVQQSGMAARASVDEGADALMHLITAPGLETGQYFNGLRPTRANAQAYDADARAKLREISRKLAGM